LEQRRAQVQRLRACNDFLVDLFIGDAIMALFGVPDAREDADADAVRAALEVRESLAAFNLRRQALGLRTIRIGIGIHSGQAVVGFVGSHLRQTYTAVGDVVNTAARLESLTKELNADILVSEEVEQGQQRHGVAETTFRGHRELKGRSRPVRVFQVTGRRQAPAGG
jgi:class 3 adenylate cyclase